MLYEEDNAIPYLSDDYRYCPQGNNGEGKRICGNKNSRTNADICNSVIICINICPKFVFE